MLLEYVKEIIIQEDKIMGPGIDIWGFVDNTSKLMYYTDRSNVMEIYDYQTSGGREGLMQEVGMLVKSDAKKEKEIIDQLIENDPELMRQHELFKAEMAFKQELINTRKMNSLTQKDISKLSGLSQQAVSRMENGTGGTIETIIRYLSSMGYSLSIKKNS